MSLPVSAPPSPRPLRCAVNAMASGDAATRMQQLTDWLQYFDELHIHGFYVDRGNAQGRAAAPASIQMNPVPRLEERNLASESPATTSQMPKPKSPLPVSRAAFSAPVAKVNVMPVAHGPSLFEAFERVPNDTLERIREDIGDCTRCRLCERRNKIVFGAGSAEAELVFVGEGPGHDEDIQGLPFVGRAGKLLTDMIVAMGLTRETVYIANVVKCRPPENRVPERDEVATCAPFLLRQLEVIHPKVIVCLGNVAAQNLLGTNKSISSFRGQWFDFRGSKLLATYHPAYLLRNPAAKGDVWTDLKKVMVELGLPIPRSSPKR
ncbi:MAG TPA: uracil-DNA glycosylase [Candidatus Limnocylindrales bacterium]|nr:uracil-DNA glycosylase [Candidatus Limnocylindrales bacterium]